MKRISRYLGTIPYLLILIVLSTGTILYSCTIDNVNPPFVEDQEFTIDENISAGTIVGVISGYELDEGQTVAYRITSGNEAGTFSLDPVSAHLTVADPAELDYEKHTVIVLGVTATDDHPDDPMETTVDVTITLRDLNEFAPVCEDQAFYPGPGALPGDTIGTISAHDPEPQQALLFRIYSGNEAGIFALSQIGGVLTMADTVLAAEAPPAGFGLGVEVRDQHINSMADSAQISIVFSE